MNFAASAKLGETLEKLSAFMDENVYPNEARYIEEIEDGDRWQRLLSPFVQHHTRFFADVLSPIRVPRHLGLMTRFGLLALQSSRRLQQRFSDEPARALFAGCAAHSVLPLSAAASVAFGISEFTAVPQSCRASS